MICRKHLLFLLSVNPSFCPSWSGQVEEGDESLIDDTSQMDLSSSESDDYPPSSSSSSLLPPSLQPSPNPRTPQSASPLSFSSGSAQGGYTPKSSGGGLTPGGGGTWGGTPSPHPTQFLSSLGGRGMLTSPSGYSNTPVGESFGEKENDEKLRQMV